MTPRPEASRPAGALLAALLAALAMVAAPLGAALATTAPAAATATCPPGGVTVVVDFAELAGAAGGTADTVRTGCDDAVDGERASTSIEDAGFPLDNATRDAGFVCRVQGRPADDPCVNAAPADAYWSLWWADGEGGDWVYSSRGAGTLRTPAGGLLALVWHQGDGEAEPPGVAPAAGVPTGGDVRPDGSGADADADAEAAGDGDESSLPLAVPLGFLAVLLAAGAFVTLRRTRA